MQQILIILFSFDYTCISMNFPLFLLSISVSLFQNHAIIIKCLVLNQYNIFVKDYSCNSLTDSFQLKLKSQTHASNLNICQAVYAPHDSIATQTLIRFCGHPDNTHYIPRNSLQDRGEQIQRFSPWPQKVSFWGFGGIVQ